MSASKHSSVLKDQILSAVVGELNDQNERTRLYQHLLQDERLAKAYEVMDGVHAFLEDPSTILGSPGTKHGEIAEQVEVAVRNARAIVDGNEPPASFNDPVSGVELTRNHKVDLYIDGQAFQVKFINGLNGNLDACLEHMGAYPDLAKTGGYLIPSDRYELIIKVINKEETGLADSTVKAILKKVDEIEEVTGRPFTEAVQPSVSTYPSVQLGAIEQTLDDIENDLEDRNDEIKAEIDNEHAPSLEGMAKAGLIAAAIAGTISIGTSIYSKAKAEGKNPFKGQFTGDDWAEVGLSGAKGVAVGGITGSAIYALTNFADMKAPAAAALVSATKGMASLTADYANGQICGSEYLDMGMFICTEAAIVYIASVAGQTLIPVPMLGSIIGSIAGKMLMQTASNLSGRDVERLQAEYEKFSQRLDAAHNHVIATINAEFDRLGDLTKVAFDFEFNRDLMLASSVNLAVAHGVDSSKILRTTTQVDDYFLN